MQILLLGSVGVLSKKFFESFISEHQCVLVTKEHLRLRRTKNIIIHQYHNKKELQNIFAAYRADAVIYVSASLSFFENMDSESTQLEVCMRWLIQSTGIQQFFYFTSNESQDRIPKNLLSGGLTRVKQLQMCEELCVLLQEKYGIPTRIIRLPYLYTTVPAKTHYIDSLLLDGLKKKKILFPMRKNRQIDFIHEEDLAKLIIKMLDNPGKDTLRRCNISGQNAMHYYELANALKEKMPSTTIV